MARLLGVAWRLFGSGAALLRYLPSPIRLPVREVVREAFPHAALAWRTLGISAVSLALAFAVWFMWSAIPLRLKDAGFNLLPPAAVLAHRHARVLLGRFLRIPYGLIVSTFGSRRSYAVVTLLLLLPCLATGFAVKNPATPYWVLLACAALTGIAGANFATSMGVINLWFPKQAQGTALGINGLGNFGVTIAQFTIPLVIGFSLVGGFERAPPRPRRASVHIRERRVHLDSVRFSSARRRFGLAPRITRRRPRHSLPNWWRANDCIPGCSRSSISSRSDVSSPWALRCR